MAARTKIKGFDMVRSICTIGIVLYHFSFNFIEYGISGEHFYFDVFTNGDWGNMFVAIFFMLSGALLWYNYEDRFEIKSFYLKRWLSIFPMFYLAWIPAYIAKCHENGSLWWAGSRLKFLYTLFGMDGYMMQLDPNKPHFLFNYYTLGEWFLGAILMLYILFPLFRLIFRENEKFGLWPRYIFTILLFVAFCVNLKYNWWDMPAGKNMITCCMQFWAGMLLMEYYGKCSSDRIKKAGFLAALVLAAVFIFLPLPVKPEVVMVSLLCGAALFIVLLWMGEYLMKYRAVSLPVEFISRYSFGMFLLHHVLIYAIMKHFLGQEMSNPKAIGMFLVVLLTTFVTGGFSSEIGALISRLVLKTCREKGLLGQGNK